jgi:hypothetical protein
MGRFWPITGWGISLLVGIGCALMFAPAYLGHMAACLLFLVSGLWGGGAILMWARDIAEWEAGRRLILVGMLAADISLTGGLIWFAFPAAEAQSPSASQVTITGGDNVVSVGQIGGITARVVTINPPVQPEFRILDKKDVTNPDGSHTVTITGDVASPITPGLLSIQIQANGMRNADIVAAPVGGVSTTQKRNVRRGPDFYSAEIPSPHGQYIITVVTTGASDVNLSASF